MLRRAVSTAVRRGGHGHHSAGHAEPVATLFGEAPLAAGETRKKQSWEKWHNLLLVGTAAITFAAFTARTNTNPHDWARDEAEERLRRRAEGLPVEFGVNYAGLKWLKGVKALSEEEAAALEAGEVDVSRRKALVSSKSQ